jgi:hypothetical protein
VLAVFMLSRPAAAAEDAARWTRMDTTLELTWQALHYVDWRQTQEIARHPDMYFEKNRHLGNHPTVHKVNDFMLMGALLHTLISVWLDRPYRTGWQGVTLVEAVYAVHNNRRIGVVLSLSF